LRYARVELNPTSVGSLFFDKIRETASQLKRRESITALSLSSQEELSVKTRVSEQGEASEAPSLIIGHPYVPCTHVSTAKISLRWIACSNLIACCLTPPPCWVWICSPHRCIRWLLVFRPPCGLFLVGQHGDRSIFLVLVCTGVSG
jgi:hypothetical protein